MKVWIDQDLCTGDGICTDHCPEVFRILEDGIAYVVEDGEVLNDPGGARSPARVPTRHEQVVMECSDECPGECIFVELDEDALLAPEPVADPVRHAPR
ncbi:MAG: ferredoxin [Actinomycetota bacterium]|nr:ferredoxin [Actinomycetota bacterium]